MIIVKNFFGIAGHLKQIHKPTVGNHCFIRFRLFFITQLFKISNINIVIFWIDFNHLMRFHLGMILFAFVFFLKIWQFYCIVTIRSVTLYNIILMIISLYIFLLGNRGIRLARDIFFLHDVFDLKKIYIFYGCYVEWILL